MRNLLDILNEEKSLVNRLEKIDSAIPEIEKDAKFVKIVNACNTSKAEILTRYAERLAFLLTEKKEAEKELRKVKPN